jgi:hypothetical protein
VSTEEELLSNRVYRDHRLRQRVRAELRKRIDVAENGIMAILAETFVDGARDGDAQGLAAVCRDAYTDVSAAADAKKPAPAG